MDAAARRVFRFGVSCSAAAAAITYYDYLLTFSREIHCIWWRRFNAVTVIYALTRYFVMILVSLRWYTPTTYELCKQKQIVSMVMTILTIFGIGLFTSFRAYAIAGRVTFMVFLVFLCGMFSPAANIYNFARPHTYVFNPNQGTCYTSPTPEAIRRTPKIMPVLVRSITMLGDLLLLAITWNKSYAVFKISRRTRNFKPKFAVLVLRDGTLYFIALATLNLAVLLQVIFGIYLDKNGGTTFIFVSEAVTCILIARFILNLRGIAGDMNADDGDMSMAENESGHRVSTLNFATPTVLGNLAAPLRTPFISDDDDSYRAYLRARQPFLVGLEPDRHSGSDTTSAGMMTQSQDRTGASLSECSA